MAEIPSIEPFRERQKELDKEMADPAFFSDQRKAATVSREHQKLTELIEKAEQLEAIGRQIVENEELAAGEDAEMAELAEAEIPELQAEQTRLHEEVLFGMVPPDPNDSRNTVMEIRAGAGGDEASLFAGDLYRMYQRYAEARSWRLETLGASESEAGGLKEVSFSITGEDVYRQLKYESGVHRVQRIPVTESGGRIHTSTATVAVLPEAEEVDVEIKAEEIEVSVSRASGPGGQGVNTTDSAVQILHKPTGLIVSCADERSQIKNRQKAMKVLRSRLLQRRQDEEHEKYAAERRGQIGTGDRSERIRTYNFPQSRVTDHRIGLTRHNLSEVMEGAIDEIVTALSRADQQSRIEELNTKDAATE